jgi:hypothetical protein
MVTMLPKLPTARLARTAARNALAAALALAALQPGFAHADNVPPPSVPTAIKVPDGHAPFLLSRAKGTQNYVCQRSSTGGFAWTFVAPAARLFDEDGKRFGTHYAGPTWKANDGSTVVGAVEARHEVAGAIPWLRLRATSTTTGPDGNLLTATTYIQRVNTTGGLAPTKGCDAANLGAARNVPYTADYYFYKASS